MRLEGACALAAAEAAGGGEDSAWSARALLLRQLSSSTAGPSGSLDGHSGAYAGGRPGPHALPAQQIPQQQSMALVPGHRVGQTLPQVPPVGANNIVIDAALADAHQFYRAGDYISALSKCNEVWLPVVIQFPAQAGLWSPSFRLAHNGDACSLGSDVSPCCVRRYTRSLPTGQTCCC